MIYQKSKLLLSLAMVFGLVISSAFTTAWGAGMTDAVLQDTPAPVTEEKSFTGRMVAIGIGTLGGIVVYSIATNDWFWARAIWSGARMIVSSVSGLGTPGAARAIGAAATGAAARVTGAATTGATALAAGARATGVATRAAVAGIPAAAGVARAGATRVLSQSGFAWTGRWTIITVSALTGALLGNSIYDSGR